MPYIGYVGLLLGTNFGKIMACVALVGIIGGIFIVRMNNKMKDNEKTDEDSEGSKEEKTTANDRQKREGWIQINKKKEIEVEEEAKKMPIGAKVFDIAFTVFIYLLAAAILFGALLFAFNTSEDKAIFGYRYYTITTGSMSPTYNVGDMIFVKLASGEEINKGDVITFNPSQDSDANLTHRVTEKIENYEGTGVICFRTQGDANETEDSFLIDEDRVIGVVKFGIPMIGYAVRFVQLRWYLIIPIVIMIAVFFQLLKRYFILGKDEEEQTDAAEATAADAAAPVKEAEKTDGKEAKKATAPDDAAPVTDEKKNPDADAAKPTETDKAAPVKDAEKPDAKEAEKAPAADKAAPAKDAEKSDAKEAEKAPAADAAESVKNEKSSDAKQSENSTPEK